VVGAAGLHAVKQWSTSGYHGHAVARGDGKFTQLDGDELRSTQVERNQGLNDVHCRCAASVKQAVTGAAVRANSRSCFFDRQVNPRVGIPQFLLRCWAGQGQVLPPDFVFSLGIGRFQFWIGCVSGMCHNEDSLLFGSDELIGVF
jgi:hypothetical protein